MPNIDAGAIPKSAWENFREAQHTPDKYTPELRALLDPNVVARRTNLPMAKMIEEINREVCYHWARRISGKSADHNNYRQLKMGGYSNATCNPECPVIKGEKLPDGTCEHGCDVHPLLAEITSDGTEITLGPDMVLVKARPDVHYGRKKSYLT